MRTGPDEKLLGEVTISGLSCQTGGANPKLMATITVLVEKGAKLDGVKVFVDGNEATLPNETSVNEDPETGKKTYVHSWMHDVDSVTTYSVIAKAKITLAVESASGEYSVTCSI